MDFPSQVVPPDEVRAQLENVLTSPYLANSYQLSQFLRLVVEETLAGRSDLLKQYTIAVKALGRPTDFDPRVNTIVRVQAGRLRRALRRYYDTLGADNSVIIELPKGSYVPVFRYRSTNGLSAQTADEPLAARPPHAASTVGQFDSKFSVVTEDSMAALPRGPSIAVMSFAYLGNDEAEGYFATGLTEEIMVALNRFSDFLVIGPLHRDTVREQGQSVRRIGRHYNVGFVLDGTVRTRGHMLRVTAGVADAVTGQNLWSQAFDYDVEATSVMEMENELVGQIVATIADAYGVIPRVLAKKHLNGRTESLSDYEAVLRFYHNMRTFTVESHFNAIHALQEAIRRDPSNALATAMLGDLTVSTYQLGFEDSQSVMEEGEALVRRAVALDPNCQPARYAMALIYFLRFQRTPFLEEAEKAMQLNPNHALNVAALAVHIGMVGEWERSLQLITKAMRLNPHHPGWYHLIPYMIYCRQGEYDLAWIEAQRFNIPTFYWDPLIRAAVLGQLGRQAEAKHAVDELLALVPDFEHRGQSLIRRFAYLDEHVETLMEGLGKAGMEIVGEE